MFFSLEKITSIMFFSSLREREILLFFSLLHYRLLRILHALSIGFEPFFPSLQGTRPSQKLSLFHPLYRRHRPFQSTLSSLLPSVLWAYVCPLHVSMQQLCLRLNISQYAAFIYLMNWVAEPGIDCRKLWKLPQSPLNPPCSHPSGPLLRLLHKVLQIHPLPFVQLIFAVIHHLVTAA